MRGRWGSAGGGLGANSWRRRSGAAGPQEGSAGPPVLRCQRVCHYSARNPPLPLTQPTERVRVRLWESPACGSGRRKQKTFVICVCESRRCHLYVCCHVATVKSSGRRSGLRIPQIIMSVTQQLVPVILSILSEFTRDTGCKVWQAREGLQQCFGENLTAATYNR